MARIGTVARAMLLAIAIAAPGGASAERVVVRSGEHAGFTRLVLHLAASRNWTLTQEGSTARITLTGARADFDLRDTFRKITEDRVSDVKPENGGKALSIALNCDCEVEAYRQGKRMLVVDIRDRPAESGATAQKSAPPIVTAAKEFPAPEPQPAPPARAQRYAFPFEPAHVSTVDSPGLGTMARRPHDGAPAPVDDAAAGNADADDFQSADAARFARVKRVSEAEKRLAEQLSRAVAQGLLTPRTARLPNPIFQPDTPKEAAARDAHADHATPPPTATEAGNGALPGLNLRAETSADRDFVRMLDSTVQSARGQASGGQACLPDRLLDLASWGDDRPFSEQIGPLRASLLGEFDRPDKNAAQSLARAYLFFGFGAEARQVLRVSNYAGSDASLLDTLGQIIEYGHSDGSGPLAGQSDCDSAAAFWATMSQERLHDATQVNETALLRSLSALPPHLRGLLGPQLSERLLEAGKDGLAARVLRLVERGQDAPDARFALADASLKLAEGKPGEAARSLADVVASNTDLSPRALVQLIDSRLDAGLPLDAETAGLAAAYAQEYRKQRIGTDLKRVHILALAETGAFDVAFDELNRFAPHVTPQAARAIRSHAMKALARKASDAAFAKHALATDDPNTTDIAPASANAVAKRLLDLGFPERADLYLRPGADGADGRERRLLRAQAALAQEKPLRAEADLLGLSGEEADLLRARARSMLGDHSSAERLYSDLGKTREAIGQAWLATDWARLRATDDSLWQKTARLMESPAADSAADPEAGPGTLAHDRALLEDSVASRDTMEQLLARFQIDHALQAPSE